MRQTSRHSDGQRGGRGREGGEKRGKEEREREGKTKGKKNRGKETQRDKEGGWQEGVRDSEGTADTETSAGHLEAQDRRKQAAGTEERETARNKVSTSWGEWGYRESTGHGEAGRKRVQERGRRQLASREREQTGAGVQQWRNGHSETERQFWFGGWCLEGGPGGQSQFWSGVSGRGHQWT